MLKSTITKELRIEKQFPFISRRTKGNHIRGVLLCGFFFPSKMHCSNEVVVHYNCLFQTAYSFPRVLIKALLKCCLCWTFCDVSSSPTRKRTKGTAASCLQRYSKVHPYALIWPGETRMCVAWHEAWANITCLSAEVTAFSMGLYKSGHTASNLEVAGALLLTSAQRRQGRLTPPCKMTYTSRYARPNLHPN